VVSLFSLCSLTNAQWVQTGLPGNRVNAILVSNNNLFAGTNGNGIYVSTNNGLSWGAVNNGLTNTFVRTLTTSGSNLFAGTYGGGVFRSSDNGANWNTANNGVTNPYVLTFTVSDTNIFAGTEFASGNVFRSTNNGLSWSLVNNGIPSTIVHTLAVSGFNIFAGTNGNGIYVSTNNGLNWSAANNGLTNTYIHAVAGSGANLLAGAEAGLVYISTNNGSSWSGYNVAGASTFLSFAFSGTNILAGTFAGGVFLSTDNGSTWNSINTGLTDTNVLSLAIKNDTLFAGTFSSGVWKRSLSEIIPVELVSFEANVDENEVKLNWNTATEINNSGFQIERREENNISWTGIGFVPGFGTTTEPRSYSFFDMNLSPGKYEYRLKQIDFDGTFEYLNKIEVDIVSSIEFSLEQNYPNPFNPTTTIEYSIPQAGLVTIQIYDILGREVATLVDEYLPAGTYETEFSANGLASGIYFYKLTAVNFSQTRKMLLLK
jgi:photosystem II stability/assembly factor-like uncharacterized protein